MVAVNRSGGTVAISAIIRDVTERRMDEQKLRAVQEAYMAELEHRQHEAERANQMKSEFLSGMSHELGTPLHTIIGFTELLREQDLGPEHAKCQHFIGHIHRDSQHLLALINDLLNLSKIEAGRLELQCEPVLLGEVIDGAVSAVRPRGEAKQIVFDIERTPPTLRVMADRLRLKQILYNLLSNAVKFTPAGGRIAIGLTGTPSKDDGVALCGIFVEDTGIGIAEAEHESIFDKFYQVGKRQASGREGTGLGLAITRRLVEEHGGSIELKSKWVKAAGLRSKCQSPVPMTNPKKWMTLKRRG